MNVAAFLYASTIIVGAISPGHGTHYINEINKNQIVNKQNKNIILMKKIQIISILIIILLGKKVQIIKISLLKYI